MHYILLQSKSSCWQKGSYRRRKFVFFPKPCLTFTDQNVQEPSRARFVSTVFSSRLGSVLQTGESWGLIRDPGATLKENPPVYQLAYVKEVLKGIFQLLLLNAKTHWAEFIHLPDCIWEQDQSVTSDLAFAYDSHIRTMDQGRKSQMSSIFLNQFPCRESCLKMMP